MNTSRWKAALASASPSIVAQGSHSTKKDANAFAPALTAQKCSSKQMALSEHPPVKLVRRPLIGMKTSVAADACPPTVCLAQTGTQLYALASRSKLAMLKDTISISNSRNALKLLKSALQAPSGTVTTPTANVNPNNVTKQATTGTSSTANANASPRIARLSRSMTKSRRESSTHSLVSANA